jgi:hypothetical protein
MSARNIFLGGKDGWYLGLMKFLNSFVNSLKFGRLGTFRDSTNMYRVCFPLIFTLNTSHFLK